MGTHKEARTLGENSAFEKLNYFDFFQTFSNNSKNKQLSPKLDSVKLLQNGSDING